MSRPNNIFPITIAVTMLLISFFISCDKTNDMESIDKTFLLPLQVGNFWNYEAIHYDSLKNVLYKDTFSVTIVNDTIINNQLWYNVDFNGVYHEVAAYRNNLEGLLIHEFKTSSILYKYPIMLGEKYDSSSTSSVTVTSVNEIICVPAGKFSCYNYLRNFGGLNLNTYISPGIGFIKTESGLSQNGGRLFISECRELISYKVR